MCIEGNRRPSIPAELTRDFVIIFPAGTRREALRLFCMPISRATDEANSVTQDFLGVYKITEILRENNIDTFQEPYPDSLTLKKNIY